MSDDLLPTVRVALETAVGAAALNAETIREQQRQWRGEVNRLHDVIRDQKTAIGELVRQLGDARGTASSRNRNEYIRDLEHQLADARTERDHERNLRRTIMETLENTVVEIVPLRNRVTKMITIDAILEDSATYCRDLCSCRQPECDGEHDDKAPTCGGGRS